MFLVMGDLWFELFTKILVSILGPVLLGCIYVAGRKTYRAFHALRLIQTALGAVARGSENGTWVEGPGFWLKKPICPPPNYKMRMQTSIPVLMIANLKGGVGKTTLAANLAAYFSMKWNKSRPNGDEDESLRVLLIDLDFQGSLSSMTVPDADRLVLPSKANKLVSGEIRDGLERNSTPRVSRPGMRPITCWTVPAYYDLSQAENRILVEWLLPLSDGNFVKWLLRIFRVGADIPPRLNRDARYLLAEALLDEHIQNAYDVVIVDAPPRLTTSHIQALCASTHLLVPTILDRLSGDAVARYADQVATHKLGPPNNPDLAICPMLAPLGVVCTLVPNNNRDLSGPLNTLAQSLVDVRLPIQLWGKDTIIRQRAEYRDAAGEMIAYAATSNANDYRVLRDEIDNLGDLIAHRMGAETRGWIRHET